ncbi:MAG: LPS export ABC transporter periplasmic protein LptC [Rhodobacteraceae bacterium]|jgi:lipopolysaccharide export system protein LptC|nr:LPS export ABC transporter periplasmic protein LptC [Paracoccaceae bacterium]
MTKRRAFDGRSRTVGWLKVTLPLIALGLLSTLFLVSNRIDPDTAVRSSQVDVESRLREPRLTNPTYAGTTTDGSAITIQATEARSAQKTGAPSTTMDVTASITTLAGARTDLRSDKALFNDEKNVLHLTGNVQIADTKGYRLSTETLDANLSRTEYASPGPVKGTGPIGQITANSMALISNPNADGSYLLVFNGRVKLIYQPQ